MVELQSLDLTKRALDGYLEGILYPSMSPIVTPSETALTECALKMRISRR